ncbi:MAG TPA: hypothetical protein VJ301_16465 [Propionibacteriaceae bacterium]|nr:hypothetical protein [Propionibacteriaceae bacterium]
MARSIEQWSQLAMLAHRSEESVALARRAIAMATAAGATPVLSHALTNLGIARNVATGGPYPDKRLRWDA